MAVVEEHVMERNASASLHHPAPKLLYSEVPSSLGTSPMTGVTTTGRLSHK